MLVKKLRQPRLLRDTSKGAASATRDALCDALESGSQARFLQIDFSGVIKYKQQIVMRFSKLLEPAMGYIPVRHGSIPHG